MHLIMVPGLWLNATTWDAVLPELHAAGHTTDPLTLPGMEAKDADRAGITAADHVAAVVAAIDAAPGDARVGLVAHSAGCALAHAAVDARPDRVARVVHVGGFPNADDEPLLAGLPAEHGEVAMPDWAELGEEANIADFDEATLAAFYAAAVPVPERVLTDPVPLTDDRRHGVPVTLVCPEYRADDVRDWLADGHLPELEAITDVTYVDLPAGHWPQLTRPADLAAVIVAAFT